MDTQGHTVAHFVVLFTSQKQKKYKTWQDGTMKYYSFNKKLVLIDEKGYNIDKKFSKAGLPAEGDEIEFDGHLVTVENFQGLEPYNQTAIASTIAPPTPPQPVVPQHQTRMPASGNSQGFLNYRQARKRLRMPAPISENDHAESSNNTAFTPPSSNAMQRSARINQQHPLYQQNLSANNDPAAMNIGQARHASQSIIPSRPLSDPDRSATLNNTATVDDHRPPDLLRGVSKISYEAGGLVDASNANQMMDIDMDKDILYLRRNVDTTRTADNDRINESLNSNHDNPSPNESIVNRQFMKRVRVGLSKRTSSTLHASATLHGNSNPCASTSIAAINSTAGLYENVATPDNRSFVRASAISDTVEASTNTPSTSDSPTPSSSSRLSKTFKVPLADGVSLPLVLQFPTMEKAMSALKSKRYPKRSRTVPSSFPNAAQYKDVFRRLIHEHLQILLLNYGIYYYSLFKTFGQRSDAERNFRSKGVGLYSSCHLQSSHTFHAHPRMRLKINNREHHSKYSKDDIWVISPSMQFDAASTFLARSSYYGPSSDGYVELECVTSRDDRVATKLANEHASLYALRTISASSEFMMLDALGDNLDRLPLLPYLISKGKGKKRKNLDILAQQTPACIHIERQDNLDVEQKIKDVVRDYHLNDDQERVLRQVARSLIVAPGWNNEPADPIVLVHGVFGSGKSYLAAVIIIFICDLIDEANLHREPDNLIDYKIMITSMTNVAVDRILQSLMKLGYDRFVRVGSLKKIAKNILPYTAQAKLSSNEELKELEQMLDDPQNSEQDVEYIATTIQRFRKNENAAQVQTAQVVGTTCMATAFDIFGTSTFPLVLLDESSQLMEPLSLVPIVRFQSSRLIMIGDPLQLPPTLTTSADEDKVGQGLDKTLFDRLTEMGHESIMLRTQYRCHPDISAISNRLFYAQRLLDGVKPADRKPLVPGLPTVLFVDVNGQEQRHPRSSSFWNEVEVGVAAHIIESLLQLKIPSSEIGIITLYKEQADKLTEYLGARSSGNDKGVQISTVDAFQGGEKEIIVLSTVRTLNSGFMDNNARINVALTRAKRHLFILGKQELLINNHLWCNILNHCQDNCYTANDLARMMAGLVPIG